MFMARTCRLSELPSGLHECLNRELLTPFVNPLWCRQAAVKGILTSSAKICWGELIYSTRRLCTLLHLFRAHLVTRKWLVLVIPRCVAVVAELIVREMRSSACSKGCASGILVEILHCHNNIIVA